jgi:hypothetical protein
MSRLALGPTQLPIQWVKGYFLGVKQPGCEVDHLSPYRTEVKNEWSYTAAPPICLHGVDGKHFSFLGDHTEGGDSSIHWL